MAEGRVYNFSAGPSMMPLEVLESMQSEMVNYKKSGMSVMEMSHRSKEFVGIAKEAEKDLRHFGCAGRLQGDLQPRWRNFAICIDPLEYAR